MQILDTFDFQKDLFSIYLKGRWEGGRERDSFADSSDFKWLEQLGLDQMKARAPPWSPIRSSPVSDRGRKNLVSPLLPF